MKRRSINPVVEYDIDVGYPLVGRSEMEAGVDGMEISENLAVNRQMVMADDGALDYQKTWNVTHLPTGWAVVTNLPTKGAAVAAARKLEQMGIDEVESGTPSEAAAEMIDLGVVEFKTFLVALVHQGVKGSELEKKIERWKRGTKVPSKRAAKRRPPAAKKPAKKKTPKKAAKKKATKKKPAKKKAAKKKATKKRKAARKKPTPPVAAPPVDPLDYIVRGGGRSGNPGPMDPASARAKERLLW